MITKRPADERGTTDTGWLHSRHTFSFNRYLDPNHMGFRSLRVLNDDVVEPGQGFATHPHRDAEIFTYVIEGALEHRDSMGNGSVIRAGDLQYMSAGDGVTHSEFNPSKTDRVHLLQIWILPNQRGGEPRYAEKALGDAASPNALTLLFTGRRPDTPFTIRQDTDVCFGRIEPGREVETALEPSRHAWIHVIRGRVGCLGEELAEGDGAAISAVERFSVTGLEDADFLLFDLP